MRNINSTLLDERRTSIFIAHRQVECICLHVRYADRTQMAGYGRFFKQVRICRPLSSDGPSILTLRKPDLIIVLKDGQVAEQGTHDSLFAQRGMYYDMWLAQQETTPLDGTQQAEAEPAEESARPNVM